MLQNAVKKALILRFSSFGDIVQASFVADALKDQKYTTDLLTKSDFSKAFEDNDFSFNKVYSYNKKESFALWKASKLITKENYSLIYDAHNNQRTLILKIFLLLQNPFVLFKFKTRSKFRLKRFLLFKLRINRFPNPFKGAVSFLSPLGLKLKERPTQETSNKEILLAPSAAWDLKKWPEDYWVKLGNNLSKTGYSIKFIGGPADGFIQNISDQVNGSENLSGKLTWTETIERIKESSLLIAGDTGVLHIADYFAVKSIALIGPSAFGRTTRKSSFEFYTNLTCQPCSKDGRGKCSNKFFKACLISISPEAVSSKALEALEAK